MVSRSTQQLDHKITISSKDKLPHTVSEDIKSLFDHYDKDQSGFVTFLQVKAILHYITGGVLKRSVLESEIEETLQKTSNFELADIEKISLKLWEEVGREQHQKEVASILRTLNNPSTVDALEIALKDKLNQTNL
jgi:Ca2+-binding EF-hand superfamily protein